MKHRLASSLCSALLATATAAAQDSAPRPATEPHVAHQVMPAAEPVPGESIYQLDMQLTFADGSQAPLHSLRGKPVLITMFYSSCAGACPLIAFTMRRIAAASPEPLRSRLVLLLVTFDPQRDTPAALREFSRLNHLDPPTGLTALVGAADVRQLAAVLGIRYRELPGGIFSHSAVISLLDGNGVVRARTTQLQEIDPAIMTAIRALKN